MTIGRFAGSHILLRTTSRSDQPVSSAPEHHVLVEQAIVPDQPGADFASFGDSGAVIRDFRQRPVGLLYGGLKADDASKPANANATAVAATTMTDPNVVFHPPGVLLRHIYLYTPFDAVLASMRGAMAELFGDGVCELSWIS